jgi:hypothetical protein
MMSDLRFVWLLLDTARTAPGALSGVARAAAIEQALDGALGHPGAPGWGLATVCGGERETGFRDYVLQSRLRLWAGGEAATIAATERWPDEAEGEGAYNCNTVFVTTPGRWAAAWALHERVSAALAPLGYEPVSLRWPSSAEDLFAALTASGDEAGITDFITRSDATMRQVAAEATHALDLQRRPYLDLPALLTLAPPTLTRLSLPHNKLAALPEEVRRFEALEELQVYHNPLDALPTWLADLRSLQRLYVHTTPLMADPARAAALRAALPHVMIVG